MHGSDRRITPSSQVSNLPVIPTGTNAGSDRNEFVNDTYYASSYMVPLAGYPLKPKTLVLH
jgi:hypothetical protein